jgi:hypothetical protein
VLFHRKEELIYSLQSTVRIEGIGGLCNTSRVREEYMNRCSYIIESEIIEDQCMVLSVIVRVAVTTPPRNEKFSIYKQTSVRKVLFTKVRLIVPA